MGISTSPSLPISAASNNRYVLSSDYCINVDITLPDATELIICNNARIDCRNLTLGDHSLIRIDSGTLAVASGCTLTLGENSRLDARNGTLDLTDARCELRTGGTLMLSDYPVKGGILAGGWATLTDSANDQIIAASDIEFHACRSYLCAPIAKVFDATVFEGRWDMDRAYPQWFADADCDDWSVPINQAIRLKCSGEVHLPAGTYKVKHSINVTAGIRLIGENLYYHSKKTVKEAHNNIGSIIVPVPLTASMASGAQNTGRPVIKHGFSMGCVITVNINPDILAETIDGSTVTNSQNNTIPNKQSFWAQGYPAPGTAIKNLCIQNVNTQEVAFTDGGGSTNMVCPIPFLCGIFVAGGCELNTLYFNQLWQSIHWSGGKDYADCKQVTNCTLVDVGSFNYNVDNNGYPEGGTKKIINTHAIDMGFLGDALILQGNAIHDPKNTYGVIIRATMGAIIDANIINTHLTLQNCNGATISNNHMETTDAQLILNASAATVQSNYFEKGLEPSIVILSNEFNHSLIQLSNNIFRWYARYDIDGMTFEECVNKMAQLCPYDILLSHTIDGHLDNNHIIADLSIDNCFRTYTNSTSTPANLTYGVIINYSSVRNNETLNILPLNIFNNVSPIASHKCTLIPGEEITMPPYISHNINRIKLSSYNFPDALSSIQYDNEDERRGHGLWTADSGVYSYKYRIIWNEPRSICSFHDQTTLFDLVSGISKTKYNETDPSRIIMFSIVDNDGKRNVNKTGLCFYVFLYRKFENRDGNVSWMRAKIPFAGCEVIYDNGICVSGFPWESCPEPIEDESFNDGITGIEYVGQNVAVYSTKPIDFSIGEWQTGDRVYNVGDDESWTMKIKK